MVSFLEKIISVLPESQKVAIKSLISSKIKSGELNSLRARQDEANSIFNRIKTKINSVLLSPRYVSKGDKISSSDHNQNMEEVFMDLNALYATVNDIYNQSKKQSIILGSDYQKSRATIEKLINDVKVYSLRTRNPEFNEVKLIDFNASANASKRGPTASVNPNVRLLELKPLATTRSHLINRASRATKIYTKTYSQGLKGDLNTTFPPENMVDQKTESFWGTLVLADNPVSQIYEKSSSSGTSYKVSVDGPVVEVYFKFSHVEKINTIKILPFSEYPIRILDISYRPNKSSQIFVPIKDFTESTTLDWEEYNFSPIICAEVRITIGQENYKRLSYLLPRSVVTNTDIFNNILKQRASKIISSNIEDSDFSLYVINSVSSYQNALDSLQDLYKDYGLDITIQPNIEYFTNFDKLLKLVYSKFSEDQIKTLSSTLLSNEPMQQPDSGLVNLNKYEYLLGIREVELNYQLYYPVGYYESESFDPQATVSEVQIEVDERHTDVETEWQSDFRKTSTEWEVDIGDNRSIPIHPRNIVDAVDGIPAVKDERIDFDLTTYKAYTRLGGYYSFPYRLKKNSYVVPPEAYNAVRITGSIPKIEITLTGEWFDPFSIYTIDYAVDRDSYRLPILDRFNSEPVLEPEIFDKVESNNEIFLSRFPYINYEIINSTGYFVKDEVESTWNYKTPQKDIFSGLARVTPTITDNLGNIVQQGNITGFLISGNWGPQSGVLPPVLTGNPSISNSYFGEIKGIEFGYYLKVMDSSVYAEISSFHTGDGFILKSPIVVTEEQCRTWDALATGYVFSGSLASPVSGLLNAEYSIGVGVKTDGNVYVLSDLTYSPITVLIGDKQAKNITNYETLEHPAFTISTSKANNIEYIQAGKKIYFNQKIDQKEIKVYYNWLTEYIKILGTLKFNGPINPDLTPKVNEIRVFINNLVI